MADQEKQFQTGFNHGYILSAHEPELAKAILKATHDSKTMSEYSHGFPQGMIFAY